MIALPVFKKKYLYYNVGNNFLSAENDASKHKWVSK